ncbi:MAG TPA: hypothetical protein VF335_05805, partial [Chitinivibrionales bacterium]
DSIQWLSGCGATVCSEYKFLSSSSGIPIETGADESNNNGCHKRFPATSEQFLYSIKRKNCRP